MADTTAKEVTRTFEVEKTTPHTTRFKEVTKGEAPVIGTLYIKDWWIDNCVEVEVTITQKKFK